MKLHLLKDIYDDGEDHHPPGYVGMAGDIVLVKEHRSRSQFFEERYAVYHEGVTDGSTFIVFANEVEVIDETR